MAISFRAASLLVGLTGAAIAIGFEWYAATGWLFLTERTSLLITFWTILPYVMMPLGGYFFHRRDIQKHWLSFCAFEVLVVAWIYLQTIVIYPDAQGALIFLFLPLLQAGLNLVVGVVFYYMQYRWDQPH